MTIQELAHEIPALRDEAKHLWGEEPWVYIENGIWNEMELPPRAYNPIDTKPYWEYKLHEMLDSPDPVKYLKENTK
jgi:hypothetical protein